VSGSVERVGEAKLEPAWTQLGGEENFDISAPTASVLALLRFAVARMAVGLNYRS